MSLKEWLPRKDTSIEAQVDHLIQVGYAKALGIEEGKYKDQFPLQAIQPKAYRNPFPIALPVEPRLSLSQQHSLLGIQEEKGIDIRKVVNRIVTPDRPYVIWTHDGNRYRPYNVIGAMEHFTPDEVGATWGEVLALYAQHPDFIQDRGIDAAGSRYVGDSVPCLAVFNGRPQIKVYYSDYHLYSYWGALSRGNEVAAGVE